MKCNKESIGLGEYFAVSKNDCSFERDFQIMEAIDLPAL
jgi:hypothetical protein